MKPKLLVTDITQLNRGNESLSKSSFLPHGDYFLGISLVSNKYFSKARVLQFYEGISSFSDTFTVLIGDALEKYNYMYFRNLPEKSAKEKAQKAGIQYEAGYSKLSRKYPQINVLRCSTLINKYQKEFTKLFKAIKRHYETNDNFRADVLSQVRKNLGYRIQKRDINKTRNVLAYYYLTELAIIIGLYQGAFGPQGSIQLSPKIDHFLYQLYTDENRFKDIRYELNINVSDFKYVVFRPLKSTP